MICNLLRLLLLVAAIVMGTTAFLAPKVHQHSLACASFGKSNKDFLFSSSSTTSLSLSIDRNGSNDAFPIARTDIRNFLTQRSIQSFVYLLNQCRESHTVLWIEKTLDFSSIDNFHGTGAFNQTKFPEWDSIFRDCVDHPEEVMVVQIRQRRRQQKLSGHNEYFESLKPSSSATTSSTNSVKAKTEDGEKPSTSPNKATFSTARNYLDAMKPTTLSSSTAKKPQVSKTTSRKLSGSSNYLDNLSSSSSPIKKSNSKKTTEKGPPLEDHGEKKYPKMTVCDTKKSNEVNGDFSEKRKKKTTTQRKVFGPGKSSSYLESLSTVSNNEASSGDDGNLDAAEMKTKQSAEIYNNPFLDEKSKEYELSIDPPALVRRILSVREQLSEEWVEDLDMLIKLNDEMTESLEEYNNEAATQNDEDDIDEDEGDILKINSGERKADDNCDDESSGDFDALLKASVAPVDKDSESDVSSISSNSSLEKNTGSVVVPDDEKCQKVFDRSILNTWSQSLWSPKRRSSPYRRANFDLLLLLATQESIHRVLNSYKNDNTVRPQTHEWLLDFYVDNVNEFFDGHQTYDRSEDFLEEMLKAPRTLIETNNEILAWVDPAIVAEDIVRERSEVALDWMRVAETILDEHTDLRRLLFTNMVSKSFPGDESLSDTILNAVKSEAGEGSTSSSPTEVFGAFE